MSRHRSLVVFAVLLITVCAASTFAQTVTGALSGTVTDASGAIVSGVGITARNTETGLTRTATTNGEGYFLMSFLPLGAYNVTIEAKGFKKITKTDVRI